MTHVWVKTFAVGAAALGLSLWLWFGSWLWSGIPWLVFGALPFLVGLLSPRYGPLIAILIANVPPLLEGGVAPSLLLGGAGASYLAGSLGFVLQKFARRGNRHDL